MKHGMSTRHTKQLRHNVTTEGTIYILQSQIYYSLRTLLPTAIPSTTQVSRTGKMDKMQYSFADRAFAKESKYPTGKYVPIMLLGTGSAADVFLSLTVPEYEDALARKATNTFDGLKSKLKAVKIFKIEYLNSAKEEAEALQRVAEHVDKGDSRKGSFALLLDEDSDWIVMEAIFPSITLMDCVKLDPPGAILLTYFVEAVKAFAFLHETCKPAVAHNDVHSENLLISARGTDRSPVAIIDFNVGNKSALPELKDVKDMFRPYFARCKDMGAHIDRVKSMCNAPSSSVSDFSKELQDLLDQVLSSTNQDDKQAYEARLAEQLAKQEERLLDAFRQAGLLPEA